MFYVWMLQSFGDKGLYFLFVLQSPSNKVGPCEVMSSPGQAEAFGAVPLLLTQAMAVVM